METLEEIQKRRIKTEEFGEINVYDFEGSLDHAIAQLESLRPDENEGYTNVRVIVDTNFYNDEDGYAILTVKGDRQETDKEIQVRIDAYNKQQLQKFLKDREEAEQEKRTYLQLKEKYEKELG